MSNSKRKYIQPTQVNSESLIEEPREFYDKKKDFTTLEAWIKCREVKLFFYKKILPHLPHEEKFNLEIQIPENTIENRTASVSENTVKVNSI